MTIFKTGTFHLDKNKSVIDTDTQSDILREFAMPQAHQLKIELLEISNIDNPSTIKIEIVVDEIKMRIIHLYKYRSQFIFQNDIFILDTTNIKDFQINLSSVVFKIRIISEADFKMTVYYSTDQKQEKHGFQEL